jgi:hypothetical protein
VGGLDVQLSNRAIDVKFIGKTGSPVNPGITTERAAVFLATYTGASARVASFRPHIGCIPASGGGGGGPVPYLSPSALAVAAAAPVTRRVSELRLRAGATQTATRTCARGERLLGGWHAVGFYTARPPSAQLVSSVVAKRSIGAARVRVSVRSGPAIGGLRVVVQVGAVCGGEG